MQAADLLRHRRSRSGACAPPPKPLLESNPWLTTAPAVNRWSSASWVGFVEPARLINAKVLASSTAAAAHTILPRRAALALAVLPTALLLPVLLAIALISIGCSPLKRVQQLRCATAPS